MSIPARSFYEVRRRGRGRGKEREREMRDEGPFLNVKEVRKHLLLSPLPKKSGQRVGKSALTMELMNERDAEEDEEEDLWRKQEAKITAEMERRRKAEVEKMSTTALSHSSRMNDKSLAQLYTLLGKAEKRAKHAHGIDQVRRSIVMAERCSSTVLRRALQDLRQSSHDGEILDLLSRSFSVYMTIIDVMSSRLRDSEEMFDSAKKACADEKRKLKKKILSLESKIQGQLQQFENSRRKILEEDLNYKKNRKAAEKALAEQSQ